MIDIYGILLRDAIEDEKKGEKGISYRYSAADKEILAMICREINELWRTDFHYLAELDHFTIPGSGPIIAKYIHDIETESMRAYLVHQLISDKIPDCDKLIWELYAHFVNSDCCPYDPESGKSNAFMYVIYDNAFRVLKPKRLKKELLTIAYRPVDAQAMSFTMRLLASWKIPEMRDILLKYADGSSLSAEDFGLCDDTEARRSTVIHRKRQLMFSAIYGLRYFPSPEVEDLIRAFAADTDKDIAIAANKTLKVLKSLKRRKAWLNILYL